MYKEKEIYNEVLNYFKGDNLAAEVWINKYALKDENYIYERTPDEMHRRIAKEFARIEANYKNPMSEDEIYDLLKDFKYAIPSGSPMSGIGNNNQVTSLSNCFVIGYDADTNADSYGAILKVDEEQVQLMKRRGGVGTDLSHIRPTGSSVKNSALTSTGVVSFMERYSNTTKEVAQGGRRGALMLSLSVLHPNTNEFIDAKLEDGKISGANISVRITDEFMNAVGGKNNGLFLQKYPINSCITYEDIIDKEYTINKDYKLKELDVLYYDEYSNTYYKIINAKKLWDKIIHNAWKSAEPGILFWDTIINESVADSYSDFGFTTTSTNPCLSGDSLIQTNKGNIPIREIYENFKEINYEVLTYNEKTKVLEYNKIKDAILTKKDAAIIKLVLGNGNSLKLTLDHKVFTENRGWVEVNNLEFNDILLNTTDGIKIEKSRIRTIVNINNEDVYDLQIDNNHNFFANNLLVHNCGELPLCPYDSCRLLSANLYSYVNNPFTKDAYFDFEKFKVHIKKMQKLMDDLVDLEIEKIDKIIKKIKNDPEDISIKRNELELWEKIKDKTITGRRTGLGVTAEGDMLAAMGITYASKDAIELSTKVHKLLALSAYESSVDMAIDRGPFKIYNANAENSHSAFINRIKKEDPILYDYMIANGRRNIALLTIAPAGSVSICTQTTSGIEPAFQVVYKRRKKVNHNDEVNKTSSENSFIDKDGQRWEEYIVFHHKFGEWLRVNGYDVDDIKNNYTELQIDELFKKSPYFKSTSNDIDWLQKVSMQGEIQKWVDHSISVTVNVPNKTNMETVGSIYRDAWAVGCKGITIYRDGSRDGVLISSNTNKTVTKEGVNIKKRPIKLEANIIRFQNEKDKWVAIIGINNGMPYEIFTGKADEFIIPGYIESGWIIKNKLPNGEKRYDFQFLDKDKQTIIIEGLNRKFDKKYWNYAKLISGILRHGMSINYVVNLISSLTFDNENINTWKNGITRAFKKYIKDDTIVNGETCTECGMESIIYMDGCKVCTNCGHSKCG